MPAGGGLLPERGVLADIFLRKRSVQTREDGPDQPERSRLKETHKQRLSSIQAGWLH